MWPYINVPLACHLRPVWLYLTKHDEVAYVINILNKLTILFTDEEFNFLLDPSIISNVGINNCPTEPSTTTSLMVTTIFRTITSTYMMSVGNQYTLISNKRKGKIILHRTSVIDMTNSVCHEE